MKASIIALPEFQLSLTKPLLDVLCKCATMHYDRTCKDSIKQGGLLFGWNNELDFGSNCTATLRELDLTTKICEVQAYTASTLSDEEKQLLNSYLELVDKTIKASRQLSDIEINVNLAETAQ